MYRCGVDSIGFGSGPVIYCSENSNKPEFKKKISLLVEELSASSTLLHTGRYQIKI
jgi:DUF1680 family protein